MRKITTEEFIRRARSIHGDKYDYSKVNYINRRTKVCIVCPIHGEFWQQPESHCNGSGCSKCYHNKRKKLLYGVGVNDLEGGYPSGAYGRWRLVLRRCYDSEFLSKRPTYLKCTVCDEWLIFSNFLKWYEEHYVEGWHIDKDLLVKGNKVYSPSTCCFVPNEINGFLIKQERLRTECPIGVHRSKKDDKYWVHDVGGFDNPFDAFVGYKNKKEIQAKELAERFKNDLDFRAYNALCNYQVEITD